MVFLKMLCTNFLISETGDFYWIQCVINCKFILNIQFVILTIFKFKEGRYMIWLFLHDHSTGLAWTNEVCQDNRHYQSHFKSFNTIYSSGLWKGFRWDYFFTFVFLKLTENWDLNICIFIIAFILIFLIFWKPRNKNLAMSTDPP